jgi:hypothetical protein
LREVLFVPGFANVADKFLSFQWSPVFHKRAVIEFQLPVGDTVQFCLDGIIMHQLFVPVAVGQLHVISDGIGKSLAFVSVLLTKGLIDDRFYVLPQVVELRMLFGIGKPVGFRLQCLPGRYGIRTVNLQFEIGNQEKVIPQFVSKILYIAEMGIKKSHQFYENHRIPLPRLFILQGQQVIYHLLYMPAILPHDQLGAYCIIFHK